MANKIIITLLEAMGLEVVELDKLWFPSSPIIWRGIFNVEGYGHLASNFSTYGEVGPIVVACKFFDAVVNYKKEFTDGE